MKIDSHGIVDTAQYLPSPHCDARPPETEIDLLVVHAISLPPEQFTGDAVERFFTGQLNFNAHPYYANLIGLRVSAHFFIRRNGHLIQFVPCNQRAWHAGISHWCGRVACNDFSIGVELEGSDNLPFASPQYDCLTELALALKQNYPLRAIVGHADIAPERKTDPGPYFDWQRLEHVLHGSLPRLVR